MEEALKISLARDEPISFIEKGNLHRAIEESQMEMSEE